LSDIDTTYHIEIKREVIAMTTDSKEFWNNMWSGMDESYTGHDTVLEEVTDGMKPGRALELGCGTGGNAMWLAEHGWKVTAVDYSDVAIEKARLTAKERGLDIEFAVADASIYQPEGQFELITSFYIHLQPQQRAKMFSNTAGALAPGGKLLFVSHDLTSQLSGWSDEDMKSLTSPEQIASELGGLNIEQAYVRKEYSGAHTQSRSRRDSHESHSHHDSHEGVGSESGHSSPSHTTIVLARKAE
jgi:2-polyprenyl-3-methyl-5-hydroxy-6-metoxy-1,4-benzoquinol methylase